VFQPQASPEIFTPEPTDIEFKTPDQIITEKSQPSEQDNEIYKPKTVPFTSNAPIPAPTPKEFQTPKTEKPAESLSSQTPFRVTKREEPPKPRPASMTFEPTPQPQQEIAVESPFFQDSTSQPASSESLVDYMPPAIIPKKELKKLAKEKKKQDKEKVKIEKEKKISEKREKQGDLFEAMKTSKKSKKQKKVDDDSVTLEHISPQVPPRSEPSSLFQTLTQRAEETPAESRAPFVPFTATKRVDEEEKSKLRIIPNVADIDSNFTSFTAITSSHPVQDEKQKEKKKDLLICELVAKDFYRKWGMCSTNFLFLNYKKDRLLNLDLSEFEEFQKLLLYRQHDIFLVEGVVHRFDCLNEVQRVGLTRQKLFYQVRLQALHWIFRYFLSFQQVDPLPWNVYILKSVESFLWIDPHRFLNVPQVSQLYNESTYHHFFLRFFHHVLITLQCNK